MLKKRVLENESGNPEAADIKPKKKRKRVNFAEPDKLEEVKFFLMTDAPSDIGLSINEVNKV